MLLALLGVLVLSSMACEQIESRFFSKNRYFIVGNDQQREKLSALFKKLDTQATSHESKYIIMYQIIKILHAQDELDRLNLFLSTYVEKNIEDPFNAYYLLVVAENNKSRGAYPFAIQYYERILRNYSDLLVQGNSVHLRCLENLIRLVQDPATTVTYYKDLLARFPESIDRGPIYYYLAKTYEKLGEWDLAIQAYKKYLAFPEAVIPDAPNVKEDVEKMVTFYDRKDKDWVWENLNDLVASIKNAIWTRNANRLLSYRGRVNFFAQPWETSDAMIDSREISPDDFIADIEIFLRTKVHTRADIDITSNSREAYLKTWGWSHRIRTWYLYFRRVDFPADPEIHGKWEWGGIYFGEKPFSAPGS